MGSTWHPTTGGLCLKGHGASHCSPSPEVESVQSPPYYSGGPLMGVHDSPSPNNSTVYTNEDGTRVVFGVDPSLAATRNSVTPTPVNHKKIYLDLLRVATGDIFGTEEQPTSPTSLRDSIMTSIGNNKNLLLLADVALGTYWQEGQQPAHAASAQGVITANTTPPAERQLSFVEYQKACVDAIRNASPALIWRGPPQKTTDMDSSPYNEQQPVHVPSSPKAVTTNSSPSVEQPSSSESSVWGGSDDYSPQNEQQPVHVPSSPKAATTDSSPSVEQPSSSGSSVWGGSDDYSPQNEQQPDQGSTQGPNTSINTSPPSEQRPVREALNQGFTAIDPALLSGGFAPINSHPSPRFAAAPLGPSRRRKRAVKKSQKSKPRTTGFNRETGEGMLTDVCGIATPAQGTPVASVNKKGNFRCPRCNGRYTRARTVKDHFITCVKKYGNPNGLSWWDHETLTGTKDWYFGHLPTVKEEDEIEWEEDGDDQEHQEDNEDGAGDEVDGSIAQAIESDVAAGEEDQEGDSHMGDEDQGRYASVSAGSTPYYTPNEGSPLYAPNLGSPVHAPNQGSPVHAPNQGSPFYALNQASPIHAPDQGSPFYAPQQVSLLSAPNQGSPFYARNQGSDTPGYGPDGYRTPMPTNIRGLSPSPLREGGSYTPSFGLGYETPVRGLSYDSDQFRDTDIIRRRETEGYGDETPTAFYDDDGDSVMS